VPVSGLVTSYSNNQHCIDWYIDELGMILELHGKQHYQITNYGNAPYEKVTKDFYNMRYRDNAKKQALLEAGFEYREINYRLEPKLNAKLLKDILLPN